MYFPSCPKIIFSTPCNKELFCVIVDPPYESSKVRSVGVLQLIIIKFSILFSFIIENLTGLKVFIHRQPWYQGCAHESGNHFNSWLLAHRPWVSKLRKPLGSGFHSQNYLWAGAQITDITRENQPVLADHRQKIIYMCIFRFFYGNLQNVPDSSVHISHVNSHHDFTMSIVLHIFKLGTWLQMSKFAAQVYSMI